MGGLSGGNFLKRCILNECALQSEKVLVCQKCYADINIRFWKEEGVELFVILMVLYWIRNIIIKSEAYY